MLTIPILTLVSTIVTFSVARSLYPLEVPAQIIMDITGLNSMSRVLWLESRNVTDANADTTGDDLTKEMTLQTNALTVYNHTTGDTEPIEGDNDQKSVYASLVAWTLQTEAFLEDLASHKDAYHGALLEDIVGNVTLLGKAADVYGLNFPALLPKLADEVGELLKSLEVSFHHTAAELGGAGLTLEEQRRLVSRLGAHDC
ncbi:MAG: hypothetical protein LQ338_007488 [Usnochroma carphineum]|nr:MAG: hypothetical protein LQ338_007488 [Usnochroma carphineum]